ncbi:MAG: hypothetical protein NTZ26_02435 [Candidatus Aminicenantes bacterium]|nr:hypothetical protein [Candidatus Aminicenantes bacterium]
MKGFAVVVLAGLLLFTGCSKSTPSDNYNLTGNWSGNIRFSTLGISATVNYTFTQAGTAVTGTFTIDTGRNGTFSGTLSGSTLSGTMTFQDACTGTASVSGTVKSSTSIDGNGTANDCKGTNTFTFSIGKS